MTQVKRLTIMACCAACFGGIYTSAYAQQDALTDIYITETPAQSSAKVWTLQACIDYALEHNISLRKDRVSAQSTAIDQLTAKIGRASWRERVLRLVENSVVDVALKKKQVYQ